MGTLEERRRGGGRKRPGSMKHTECNIQEQKECHGCEFNLPHKSGPGIGTVLSGERGEFRYCENGFWKEET